LSYLRLLKNCLILSLMNRYFTFMFPYQCSKKEHTQNWS